MLVEALIHHEFEEAAKAVQGFSVQDCLFQAPYGKGRQTLYENSLDRSGARAARAERL